MPGGQSNAETAPDGQVDGLLVDGSRLTTSGLLTGKRSLRYVYREHPCSNDVRELRSLRHVTLPAISLSRLHMHLYSIPAWGLGRSNSNIKVHGVFSLSSSELVLSLSVEFRSGVLEFPNILGILAPSHCQQGVVSCKRFREWSGGVMMT